jgi:hypothetical protein
MIELEVNELMEANGHHFIPDKDDKFGFDYKCKHCGLKGRMKSVWYCNRWVIKAIVIDGRSKNRVVECRMRE